MKTVSLFSGCGGMDLGFQQAGFNIVFANDFDKYAAQSYRHNFGEHMVEGDLSQIHEFEIPKHQVLIGGFPCQPFSMMGQKQGFLDNVRGTLFFEVARIIEHHQPEVIVLENVRNLRTHDNGNTLKVIIETLENLNYEVHTQVLNSLDYGVPQKRNRIFIVCFRKDITVQLKESFQFPAGTQFNTDKINIRSILEQNVDPKYYLSHKILPTILSHGSGGYYSKSEIDLPIARPLTATMAKMHRANQDNYVTDPNPLAKEAGKTDIRRLTPRECARLQGFPDDYEIVVSDSQAYKQFGNAVTVNVAQAIAESILTVLPNAMKRETANV
ncbi:DNA cytosine methyltransferase [Solibacillus sp. FSL W7-1324]|uniref:DNA cytosine methyltransferase n=1 Tax=Solibacillus sp. FSL W7-1324 TaxID=2921701 RepID=UPI0030F83BD8